MLSNGLCGKNQLEKAIMRQHEQRTHKGGRVHPQKLTWKPKMEVLKMAFLFNWVMFRFHVNFLGSIPTNSNKEARKQLHLLKSMRCQASLKCEA